MLQTGKKKQTKTKKKNKNNKTKKNKRKIKKKTKKKKNNNKKKERREVEGQIRARDDLDVVADDGALNKIEKLIESKDIPVMDFDQTKEDKAFVSYYSNKIF